MRPALTARLASQVAADIRGNTDSEYLFALLRQILQDTPNIDMPNALSALFTTLGELIGGEEALLNFVLTDGTTVYANRHGINHEAPSLYYTDSDPMFPGGLLVASEAFSPDAGWQPVPEQHVVIMRAGTPPQLLAL